MTTRSNLVIAGCAAVGLLLRLYQLCRPGFLLGVTQYDDGVLFGNAVRLVGGVIPYRDFVMVQPPGSALLMAPVALLAKGTGTAWGLAVARILTVCADTACVVLLGLLTRHRGTLAVAIACGTYAIYPGALVACSTFLLEPWLNLCCLGAALLIFRGDGFAVPWRVAAGGAVFGFAVSIKLWAAVPLLMAGLVLAGKPKRFGMLAAGALGGLAAPVLPFLILAPGQFISQVVTSQYLRSTLPHPLSPRLADMAGLSLFPGLPRGAGNLVLAALAIYLVAGYLVPSLAARRLPPPLDWYALASLGAVVGMFLLPSEYYPHYAAFAGPFAALTLALPAGRRHAPGQTVTGQENTAQAVTGQQITGQAVAGQAIRSAALPVSGLLLAVLVASAGIRQVAAAPALPQPLDQVTEAERLIPAGSCVITNDPALTIVANRFTANNPGCPAVVDAYGTLLTMTGGRPQTATIPTMQTAELTWQDWFQQAGFVWLDPVDHGLPWVNSLYNYLGANYQRITLPGDDQAQRGGLFLRLSPAAIKQKQRHHHHHRKHKAGDAKRSPTYR